MRLAIATVVFFGALALQLVVSALPGPMYPLNAYRMFATPWRDGILMERIIFVDALGTRYRSWDVLSAPFFQANHVSYVTFLDPAPDSLRQAVCRLALERARRSQLAVLSEQVRYRRDGGLMIGTTESSEQVYTCRH